MKKFTLLSTLVALVLAGCASKDQLKKTLEDNPEIVINVIEKHPLKFMEALNKAAQDARKQQFEDEEKKQSQAMEEEFKNPKTPEVDTKRAIFGKADAKITIVEYSDFECPFCTRGYRTVKEVKDKYKDQVRVVYKHLPLDFHPTAEPAARFFEAVAIDAGAGAAEKFHDYVFENQEKLKSGKEKFLEEAAKKAGANLSKVKTLISSEEVTKRIEADKAEAAKFGFSGTPGFLINGVSLRGAYPANEFAKIIDRHLGVVQQ